MPYIEKKRRQGLDYLVDELYHVLQILYVKNDVVVHNPGDINYVLSRLIWRLFNDKPAYVRGLILRGILADVRHEFTRRLIDQYEDKKIEQNGDLPEGGAIKDY